MSKKLVAYFSASGVTAKVAGVLSKTIVPFATSGGSGMGKTNEKLLQSCNGATLLEGKIFKSNVSAGELTDWVNGFFCD